MQPKILALLSVVVAFLAFLHLSRSIFLGVPFLLIMSLLSFGIWRERRLAYLAGFTANLAAWGMYVAILFTENWEEGWEMLGVIYGVIAALLLLPSAFLLFRLYRRSTKPN